MTRNLAIEHALAAVEVMSRTERTYIEFKLHRLLGSIGGFERVVTQVDVDMVQSWRRAWRRVHKARARTADEWEDLERARVRALLSAMGGAATGDGLGMSLKSKQRHDTRMQRIEQQAR